MTSPHSIAVLVLLGVTVTCCCLGALGMIRMRDPFQALHYLALPATIGMGALTCAVFVQTGMSPASWKCIVILMVLLATNSVGTHAAARAFRTRQLGHWQPLPDDKGIEWLEGKPRT